MCNAIAILNLTYEATHFKQVVDEDDNAAFVPLLCKDEKCDGILGKIGEDYPTKAAKYVPISMEIAEKVFMPNVGKVDVKEAQRYKDYE